MANVLTHGLFGAVRIAGVDAVDDHVVFACGDVRRVVRLAYAVQAIEAKQGIQVFAEQAAYPVVAAALGYLSMKVVVQAAGEHGFRTFADQLLDA